MTDRDGPATGRGPDILRHRPGDHVAVAVRGLEPGPARVGSTDSDAEESIEVTEAVPLGHKVALVDLEPGAEVTEYGVRIAVATQAIRRGALVHTHNVRSARWQHSA